MIIPLSPADKGWVDYLCCSYQVFPHCDPLWGFIAIMLLGLASFSFSVSFSRSVMVLLFFLRSFHLFGEFLQVSQQTLVGETECLNLVNIGL